MNPAKKDCLFCFKSGSDDLKMGKLYNFDSSAVHYYCLLFASGLEQKGNSDSEGIVGFLPEDIMKELKRGKRWRCNFCRKVGATVGCCTPSCRKVFHLPCAQNHEALCQFFGSFNMYCSEHRRQQQVKKEEIDKITKCHICFCDIDYVLSNHVIFPPCCRNGLFHRLCVQKQAISSGYFFFKCPLCNNKDIFQEEMLAFGIYIPEQDASWERDNDAFQELYVRHSQCNIEICCCPKGRNYSSDVGDWRIILCTMCGSQGCHIKCGKINSHYECSDCDSISKNVKSIAVNKTPPPPVLELQNTSIEVHTPCVSTTMTLQQFLGGCYSQSSASLIYVEGDANEEESEELILELQEEDFSMNISLPATEGMTGPSREYSCSSSEHAQTFVSETNRKKASVDKGNFPKAQSDENQMTIHNTGRQKTVLKDKKFGQSSRNVSNDLYMTFTDNVMMSSVRLLND